MPHRDLLTWRRAPAACRRAQRTDAVWSIPSQGVAIERTAMVDSITRGIEFANVEVNAINVTREVDQRCPAGGRA